MNWCRKWFMVMSLGWLVGSSFAASHHPQAFLTTIKGTKNEGLQIVQHFCSNCHAVKPLISLGAPRVRQKEDWEPRVKKGLRQLLAHTEEGLRAMPPRGGCFECTDEQLILAVLAMLPDELLGELKDHKKSN